jgi:hypothetical protein
MVLWRVGIWDRTSENEYLFGKIMHGQKGGTPHMTLLGPRIQDWRNRKPLHCLNFGGSKSATGCKGQRLRGLWDGLRRCRGEGVGIHHALMATVSKNRKSQVGLGVCLSE